MKALFALLLMTVSASAYETPCVPIDTKQALANIDSSFGEKLHSVSLPATGAPGAYMLTTSADGDTWTLMMVNPPGLVCIIATGHHWTDVYPLDKSKSGQ